MSMFEFLMVLVSLIIGLGVTELLHGVSGTIRHRDTTRPYWIHGIFVVIIFLALLQQWWEIWGLRSVEAWTFPGLLMMLGGPIGLFLIANLIFPSPLKDSDFRTHYYESLRPVLFLGIATVLVAVTFRPLTLGTPLIALDNLSSFVMIGLFILLSLTRRPWVHGVTVTLILIGLLSDIFMAGFRIS